MISLRNTNPEDENMKEPPILMFLGDEERAMTHATEALTLYHAGLKDGYLRDDTTISVNGNVVTVEATFHPQFSLFTPVDVPDNPGQYRLRRLGAIHRKDAMLPMGLFSNATVYDAAYPDAIGSECFYGTDGILATATINVPATLSEKADIQDYILNFSIAGVTEDLIQGGNESAMTPQGFLNASAYVYSCVSLMSQGDTYYSAAWYGVDRSGSYPVYAFSIGHQVYATGTLLQSAYNNGGGTSYVKYYEIYQAFSFLKAGRQFTTDSNSYGLGTDVIEYDAEYPESGIFHNAPYPVVIPLGNQRVFILYRERVADANKIFGGTFRIQAYLASGSNFSFTSPAVSGITSFLDTPAGYGCGTVGSGYSIPQDAVRVNYLFETLGISARTAVPVSQDETLVFGWKDPLALNTTIKWICYSVTPTAITEKSIVVGFYTSPDPSNPRALNHYSYRGAVHLGGTKVAVYFLHLTMAIGANTWSEHGIVRFLSDDDGTTWDSGTLCSYTSSVANNGMLISTKPIYIGETSDAEPTSIVALGAADRETIDANTFYAKNAKIMSAPDDGLTFVETHSGAGDLKLTATGSVISGGGVVSLYSYANETNGIMSLVEHGEPISGFAPSPYKHLPTYYGTPTKASRDSSGDPGL